MNNKITTLITEQEINAKIREAGNYISRKYSGNPLLVVGILKGCFMFMAELAKNITVPCEFGFMSAESYCGTESTGSVNITLDLKQDISEYHVIIAEDITDTGRTLKNIKKILEERSPLSLSVITLLDKPERREVDFVPDMALFTIPDIFVVGYGLDYNEYYRNLPYIGKLE
ncbi:MAG: hypoxanthine phosphoribosyltransferase [Ruminococcus sp.]|nr:hypoxanthine phosphoribosyltransferase [Ruminococcus sp.]MDE7225536.1 hypoxanthine phosphoribosyltransferase [Ruminococcus sp.]